MSEPTQKQIDYATKLGISIPFGIDKEALSKAIDERVGGNKPIPAQGITKPGITTQGIPTEVSRHDIVIQRVEAPHSFEFGKAGERHKVYYREVKELQAHIKALEDAGLYYASGTEVEVEKTG